MLGRGGGEEGGGGAMYPRVYCPGRGDNITREGTLYPRVNCPGGHFLQGDNISSDTRK